MYKLIACDMDETLLDEHAQVSKGNQIAIKAARDAGIQFVLASGRGFPAMQTTAKVLGLYDKPNEYMISFNGGAITENRDNKLLDVCGITFDQMKTLFEIGLPYDIGFHIYTLNDVYIYRMTDEEREYVKGRLDGYIELESPNIDFLVNQPLVKILFHNNSRQYLEMIEHNMAPNILSQFSVSYSGNRYLEFNQQGVSKGAALLKLIQKLSIKPEEVIAIGDNNNDISMLNVAGLGIAVQNATPDAKAAADYICPIDHKHSAIANVINQFIFENN